MSDYEEQLQGLAEAIKWCDDYLENTQFDKTGDEASTLDMVLDRRAQLLKMQAQTQEILDNEAKMKNEASEKKKSRWGTWIMGGLGIGAPLWVHCRQFNRLAEIEKNDELITSQTGKNLVSKAWSLLNFKK